MNHRNLTLLVPILLLVLILLAFTLSARATEIVDSEFGFRVVIPEPFFELQVDQSEPDTIYKYVDREPTPGDPAVVIQVQRLRGLISLRSRMKPSEIPQVEGISTTLQEFKWKQHDLDVMRQTITLPTGVDYVVYGIQYPLTGEAVQLQVGGPLRQDQEVYGIFSQVAQGFSNTKPLLDDSDGLSIRKLSAQERTQKLISGIVRLTITAIVVLLVFRFVMRIFTKKTPRG